MDEIPISNWSHIITYNSFELAKFSVLADLLPKDHAKSIRRELGYHNFTHDNLNSNDIDDVVNSEINNDKEIDN